VADVLVAALYVQPGGVYSGRSDVDLWDEARDARKYAGPWPVVAHPPCAAWGNYSKPTAESTARGPLRGDDGGCFAAALASVRRWGGVLEHPRRSAAWATYALPTPPVGIGWISIRPGEWACQVDQGHYGHIARKPTWLFFCGPTRPPELVWCPARVAPIGTGERRGNLESMSKTARAATPAAFAELLIGLGMASRPTIFPLPLATAQASC
jgi:hypothetical protein